MSLGTKTIFSICFFAKIVNNILAILCKQSFSRSTGSKTCRISVVHNLLRTEDTSNRTHADKYRRTIKFDKRATHICIRLKQIFSILLFYIFLRTLIIRMFIRDFERFLYSLNVIVSFGYSIFKFQRSLASHDTGSNNTTGTNDCKNRRTILPKLYLCILTYIGERLCCCLY